jgi:hypothetical protein
LPALLLSVLRKIFSFPVMLASIIVVFVFLAAGSSVGDPDIWWHLRNAEYLFATGSTPQFDFYSYTTNSHPWMNHEWLAEIPYYLAWRVGGLMGIYVLFVGLLCVIMLGIYYWAYRESRNLKAAFLVTVFSMFLAKVNFGPRTILFGYLYLLILLLILGHYRATGQGPLWAIPPLFCLWINTHGSWLLGMIVFGIYLAGGLVEGSWGRVDAVRWRPAQRQRLLLTLAASIAALLVNPFTYRLVAYPFDLAFRQRMNVKYIEEWASVNFNEVRGIVVLILLAGVFLGALFRPHRWKLEELLLTCFTLYAGLKHVRFLFLAAIIFAPLFARMLDMIPPYKPQIDKTLLNAAVMVCLLVLTARRFPSDDLLGKDIASGFPEGAVAFIKSHGLPGNLYNRYEWGGYLIFFCPGVKTFIDSRTDIFDYTGVLKQYLNAESVQGSLGILDSYGVEAVLLPPNRPLSYLLKNNAGWKIVYSDKVALIFERTTPKPLTPQPSRRVP